MLGQNLVSHLGVYSRARLVALGGLRAGFEGSQDHDLALRMARACGSAAIRHIPEVLYHWRQLPTSFSASHAAEAGQAGRRAVADYLPPDAAVRPAPGLPHWHRIVHPLPSPAPLVTLLVDGGRAAPRDAEYPQIEIAPPRHRGKRRRAGPACPWPARTGARVAARVGKPGAAPRRRRRGRTS